MSTSLGPTRSAYTLAIVLSLGAYDRSGEATQNVSTPPDQMVGERVAFLALCGLDDWVRPPGELRQEDIDLVNQLIPLNKFKSMSPRTRQPRGSRPPGGCDDYKARQPAVTPAAAVTSAAAPAVLDLSPCSAPTCFVKREPPVSGVTDRVRLAVIGDIGEWTHVGKKDKIQDIVARQVRNLCSATPARPNCSFALFLGDNLYPDGISATEDEDHLRKLIESYELPAYVALGNHDWHPFFAQKSRAERTLAFLGRQKDMVGNSHFYDFAAGPARFWAIDSNFLVRIDGALDRIEEESWLKEIKQSPAEWKIVFGHHPYLSNGHHGNAGDFEDALIRWRGKDFKKFIERHVLEEGDLLLSGHDHNLQFYPTARKGSVGAALVVTGAGARCKGPGKRRNTGQGSTIAPAFEYYGPGFTVLNITTDRLTVEMHRFQKNAWTAWQAWKDAGDSKWNSSGIFGPESDPCAAD